MNAMFQDIIAGGTILAVIFIIFKYYTVQVNKKIDEIKKLIDEKRSIDMCNVLHEQVEKSFDEGEKKFEKLEQTIKGQTELIARIDKNVAVLAAHAENKGV